jgi:hypothetical protein
MDEALDEDVLVTNTPTLVNNYEYKYQHHHDDGGGEGYGEDNVYFHKLCIFSAKVRIGGETIVSQWEKIVSKREKKSLTEYPAPTVTYHFYSVTRSFRSSGSVGMNCKDQPPEPHNPRNTASSVMLRRCYAFPVRSCSQQLGRVILFVLLFILWFFLFVYVQLNMIQGAKIRINE